MGFQPVLLVKKYSLYSNYQVKNKQEISMKKSVNLIIYSLKKIILIKTRFLRPNVYLIIIFS